MKVLITGGFGYLGGRLAKSLLLEPDFEVVIATRNNKKSDEALQGVKIVKINWDSISSFIEICTEIDVIIHAAGINATNCSEDPVNALDFNGVTTAKLMQAAIKQNVKKFIYLSTAHVYGSPLIGQINEQTCINSIHPYATSHRAGEDTVRFAHQQNKIEGVVLRLSNACGAPVNKDVDCWMLIVNDLCKQAVLNKELTLNTSGKQYRNFIPMSEVNHAVLHFINLTTNLLGDGVFNIGGPSSLRVIDVAKLIAERCTSLFGFTPNICLPEATVNENESILDYQISKLLSTGYSHTGHIKEEIDQTLEFCHSEFGIS